MFRKVPVLVQERKIHTIYQLAEKYYEQGSALHILYIDFKQVFPGVGREVLLEDTKAM